MKPMWIKGLVSFVVPCATLVLGARQANAQFADAYADVTLKNETPWPLLFTNGKVTGLFGFAGTWRPTQVSFDRCHNRPDGSPPGIAAPDNTQNGWGSDQVSWGAYAVDTMAGSITVSALDVTGSQPTPIVIGTLQWTMYQNASYCPVTWQPIPSSFASTPFSISYSSDNSAPDTCAFGIELQGGPALQPASRPASLTAGQTLASPSFLFSTVGWTSLQFQGDSSGACNLVAVDSANNPTVIANGAVMAIMDGNSNFAAYDINGNEVWSTGTASYPGGWLQVDAGMIRVLRPWQYRGKWFIKTLWQMNVP
jgi:hypothetical protein